MDRRGQAGAREKPIGVPVRIVHQAQGDVEGATRLDAGHGRHELGLDRSLFDGSGAQRGQAEDPGGGQAKAEREIHGDESSVGGERRNP